MQSNEPSVARDVIHIAAQEAAIPEELWIMIWKDLDLTERFGVSQVCRWWRNLARSTPQLWSRINFHTSLHSESCPCKLCAVEANIGDATGLQSLWRPPGAKSSLDLVLAAPALGRDTPVDLEIEVIHRTAQECGCTPKGSEAVAPKCYCKFNLEYMYRLASCLKESHSLRIARLTFTCSERHSLPIINLFAFMRFHLSSLRFLECRYQPPPKSERGAIPDHRLRARLFANFEATPQLAEIVLNSSFQYQLDFVGASKHSGIRRVVLSCKDDRAIYDLFCFMPNLRVADIALTGFTRGQAVEITDKPLARLCNDLTKLHLRYYVPEPQDLTYDTPLAALIRRYRELNANTLHV